MIGRGLWKSRLKGIGKMKIFNFSIISESSYKINLLFSIIYIWRVEHF